MLASIDNCIHIWETDQSEPSYTIEMPFPSLQAAVFTKDPRKLIVGGKNEDLFEVDIYNRKKRKCNLGKGCDCRCLATNNDCDLIAVGSSDGSFHLISYPEFVKVASFKQFEFAINAVEFLKDGKTAVCGDSVGHLLKFGVFLEPATYSKLPTQRGAISSIKTLQTGDLAVVHNKSLYIYDFYDETPISIYDIGSTAIVCASKMHDSHVVIGTQFGKVQIYDFSANSVISEISVSDGVTALTLTPDGQNVVAAYAGGIDMFRLYNTKEVSHYPMQTKDFSTALSYQSEIIAIPEDAIFGANSTNPSQIFFSRSQINKSTSMRCTDTTLTEEEDYTENKISFKRSLASIRDAPQSPATQCLTKSGILSTPKKSSIVSNESEKHVSGILTFSKTGSPMFKSRNMKTQARIAVPPIDGYPKGNDESGSQKPMPSILNSPRATPRKINTSISITNDSELDADIPDSPFALRASAISPDDISGCNSPIPNKSCDIDEDATTAKLRSMNEELLKRLDEITARLSVLESNL